MQQPATHAAMMRTAAWFRHRQVFGAMVLTLSSMFLIRPAPAGTKDSAPPSPDRPWSPPDMITHQTELQARHLEIPGNIVVDPSKVYHLPELIDLAQRLNPDTKVAWQRAKQALAAVGLKEVTYYPILSALGEANSQLQQSTDQTVREVWQAYTDLHTAISSENAADALLRASQDAYNAVLSSYKVGLSTYTELVTSETRLTNARNALFQSRTAIHTAATALALALGDLAQPGLNPNMTAHSSMRSSDD